MENKNGDKTCKLKNMKKVNNVCIGVNHITVKTLA